MIAEIVQFAPPGREELVWICNCGCTTHYHHDNGNVECGACGIVASVSDDGWRARLPPAAPGEARELGPESFKVSHLNDASGWLRRTAKDQPEAICAMVAVYSDGSLSTWRDDAKAPDGRQWIADKVRESIARIE